jgi:hypothetical protein
MKEKNEVLSRDEFFASRAMALHEEGWLAIERYIDRSSTLSPLVEIHIYESCKEDGVSAHYLEIYQILADETPFLLVKGDLSEAFFSKYLTLKSTITKKHFLLDYISTHFNALALAWNTPTSATKMTRIKVIQ